MTNNYETFAGILKAFKDKVEKSFTDYYNAISVIKDKVKTIESRISNLEHKIEEINRNRISGEDIDTIEEFKKVLEILNDSIKHNTLIMTPISVFGNFIFEIITYSNSCTNHAVALGELLDKYDIKTLETYINELNDILSERPYSDLTSYVLKLWDVLFAYKAGADLVTLKNQFLFGEKDERIEEIYGDNSDKEITEDMLDGILESKSGREILDVLHDIGVSTYSDYLICDKKIFKERLGIESGQLGKITRRLKKLLGDKK